MHFYHRWLTSLHRPVGVLFCERIEDNSTLTISVNKPLNPIQLWIYAYAQLDWMALVSIGLMFLESINNQTTLRMRTSRNMNMELPGRVITFVFFPSALVKHISLSILDYHERVSWQNVFQPVFTTELTSETFLATLADKITHNTQMVS